MRKNLRRVLSLGVLFAFLITSLGPIPSAHAQELALPKPGVMVHLSPAVNPPILKGLKVHTDNPFRFDFILDKGDSEQGSTNAGLKEESSRLIKYFLASLTIPEKDLWVNLSPYEKDRIIPNSFGLTEMGRDLLAQDYILKQITASLIYPEDEIGKKFWKRIYEEAQVRYGTTNIPVNTFNKVWIVPQKAVVYENAKAGTAYVVESRLKVMLEEDYLAMGKNIVGTTPRGRPLPGQVQGPAPTETNKIGSQIIHEIVIPELTKEINEGSNFVQLRQVYSSLILATWYKKKIKDSILARIYADKNKIAGVGYSSSVMASERSERGNLSKKIASSPLAPRNDTEEIYQRYLQAFKRGAYNYIKVEIDPVTQQSISRKYFSGGMLIKPDIETTQILPSMSPVQSSVVVSADLAMSSDLTSELAGKEPGGEDRGRKSLEALRAIKYEDINVNQGTGLKELVREALGVSSKRKASGVKVSAEEYVGKMQRGERIIDQVPQAVDTIMGRIDLGKLNDINAYDKKTIVADLLRDLWIADLLGLLNVDLISTFGFSSFTTMLVKKRILTKVSLRPTVRFEDYWVIRNRIIQGEIINNQIYKGNEGQIKWVRQMKDDGKINSTNLRHIYNILEEEWVKLLNWQGMSMPLEEAEKVRVLVEALVKDKEQMKLYRGNVGQIKWVREMKKANRITSTNLGSIYSVLENEWIKTEVLNWQYINMPLEEAEKVRTLIEALIQDRDQMRRYQGNAGQIRWARQMKDEEKIVSTHLGNIYSVLDEEWIKTENLNWQKINMSLEEAEKVRVLIEALVQDPNQVRLYQGNAGQIRWIRQMNDERKIASTHPGNIYTVLDEEWIETENLNWQKMNMPLEEAEKVRVLVEALVQDPDQMRRYQGNAGQIRWVRQMKDEGKIASTHLGHIYSAFDEEWVNTENLNWEKMNMPLEEAEKVRKLIEALVQDRDQMRRYQGNAGQIRWVRQMKDEGKINATNLASIYSVLEGEWVKPDVLNWKKMDMPLEEAEKIREMIQKLVQDPKQVELYKNNAGQIKWVRQMKDGGKIASTHLSNIYSVLEEEWIKPDELNWQQMNMSLKEAEKIREMIQKLVQDPKQVELYKNNPGQIRWARQMKDEGKINSTYLGNVYSVLDKEWVNADVLNWQNIHMLLKEAEAQQLSQEPPDQAMLSAVPDVVALLEEKQRQGMIDQYLGSMMHYAKFGDLAIYYLIRDVRSKTGFLKPISPATFAASMNTLLAPQLKEIGFTFKKGSLTEEVYSGLEQWLKKISFDQLSSYGSMAGLIRLIKQIEADKDGDLSKLKGVHLSQLTALLHASRNVELISGHAIQKWELPYLTMSMEKFQALEAWAEKTKELSNYGNMKGLVLLVQEIMSGKDDDLKKLQDADLYDLTMVLHSSENIKALTARTIPGWNMPRVNMSVRQFYAIQLWLKKQDAYKYNKMSGLILLVGEIESGKELDLKVLKGVNLSSLTSLLSSRENMEALTGQFMKDWDIPNIKMTIKQFTALRLWAREQESRLAIYGSMQGLITLIDEINKGQDPHLKVLQGINLGYLTHLLHFSENIEALTGQYIESWDMPFVNMSMKQFQALYQWIIKQKSNLEQYGSEKGLEELLKKIEAGEAELSPLKGINLKPLTLFLSSPKNIRDLSGRDIAGWNMPILKTTYAEALRDFGIKDQAMSKSTPGGIDLTTASMNLETETQNSNEEFKFNIDPAMLKQLQNAPGFYPIIMNITRLQDLKTFLVSP